MKDLVKIIDKEKFVDKLFFELSKLPFGSLPKTELELVILHSIIEAQGGYENLNKITPRLQSKLKLSQTKFKNKVLQAQLRYSVNDYNAERYLKKLLTAEDTSNLTIENDQLVLIISDPLLLDNMKTFFDSREIINDTSFNKNILKINTKGLLQVIANIIDTENLKRIETEFKKYDQVKSTSFSLVGNIKIDSIFSTDISIDPLKSVGKLIGFLRKILNNSEIA